jgi:hypothetical protein
MKVFGINEKETIRHDKKTGRNDKVSVESFCLKDGFFCFDNDDLKNLPPSFLKFGLNEEGVPNHLQNIGKEWLESALSWFIEGPISGILARIKTEKSLKNVSHDDMIFFLKWLCWLFVANPNSVSIEAINYTLGYSSYKENVKELPKREQFSFYFNLSGELEPYFVRRKWLLQSIDHTHGPLLTSDRPVMIKGGSLIEKSHLINHTIYFPLSPDLLLVGIENTEWGYSFSPQESRKEAGFLATALVYDQADRFVFGTDLKALENMFNLYQQQMTGD